MIHGCALGLISCLDCNVQLMILIGISSDLFANISDVVNTKAVHVFMELCCYMYLNLFLLNQTVLLDSAKFMLAPPKVETSAAQYDFLPVAQISSKQRRVLVP